MSLKRRICAVLASAAVMAAAFTGCVSAGNNASEPSETRSEASQSTSASQDPQGSQESHSEADTITPAAWKVSDKNGNYIYMMGTIHATDSSADVMPDYIEAAYADCDAVAVEVDITSLTDNIGELLSMSKDFMYLDGTKISDHVSEETYDAMYQLLDGRNMYPALFTSFKPIIWISLIENMIIADCGLDAKKSVDERMITRAKSDGKEVLEVESAALQFGVFDSMSDELADLVLSQYVAEGAYDNQVQGTKELYENWKKGTLGEDISENDLSGLTERQKELYDEYNNKLLDQRNKDMVKTIEGYMDSGKKVFVCVGAAHFYGDNGIVKSLERDGYTVTRLE